MLVYSKIRLLMGLRPKAGFDFEVFSQTPEKKTEGPGSLLIRLTKPFKSYMP